MRERGGGRPAWRREWTFPREEETTLPDPPADPDCDVLIVGGGPAGLSAALVLGRCRRRVLVVDAGRPRNAAARELHGFLGRDGTDPLELLRLGRREVGRYGVRLVDGEVVGARRREHGFEVELADGATHSGRKLLLATGLEDRLPDLEGLPEMYGISVHHCPYCDGWEQRDRALVAYGAGRAGARLAKALLAWSPDVALLTDGPARLSARSRRELKSLGITVYQEPVAALEGEGGRLARVRFTSGEALPREALFFVPHPHRQRPLAEQLGCRPGRERQVRTNRLQATEVPGLYAAGDAARDVQLAILAAAEGAKAAVAIHAALAEEEAGK